MSERHAVIQKLFSKYNLSDDDDVVQNLWRVYTLGKLMKNISKFAGIYREKRSTSLYLHYYPP